jgi:cytochrome P450
VADRTPIVDFDHHSPQVAADPAKVYRELRHKCPVFWTEKHGGYWVFTKYEHVAELLSDDARFSSARRSDAGGEGSSVSIPKRPSVPQYPLELDPPDSVPYRRILNPLLSPAAAERVRDAIRTRVAWCIDQFVARGECDLVRELASAVPASVTIDWLGLPHESWPRLSKTMHDIAALNPEDPRWLEASRNLRQMYVDLAQVIEQRRRQPADDVISVIAAAPITPEDALGMVGLLVAGGVDTTTSVTSQALVWLSDNRGDHRRLLTDASFLRSATEEFLRMYSPAQALARTMNGETTVGGCAIHDGDRLLIGFASANRDADVFDDPDSVMLDRFPNRHLAFGIGMHRCVGSNLARVMFEEMTLGVLSRIPDYVVDASALRPYFTQGLASGWQQVPARFTPGRPTGAVIDVTAFRMSREAAH